VFGNIATSAHPLTQTSQATPAAYQRRRHIAKA
jgi:hypothetical protein